jgi:glycosyltransferase involved in cell wall biosynthesis
MKRRIAIVAPIAVRYDAISAAAADNFRLLQAEPGWQVDFLTSHNELHLPARILQGISDLLSDDIFRSADVIIYHFGIYHPFLDALLVGNGHARQVVVFHNITPPEFVSPSERPVIDNSLRQAHNLRYADEIWADSEVNAEALKAIGVIQKRLLVVPLAVSRPDLGRLRDKLGGMVEFLFVGRIVAAKGVRDLIAALARARPAIGGSIRLCVAGNAAFSDPAYIASCKTVIFEYSLQDCVEFIDTPSDETLCELYARAHVLCIPSFHEGFCVPVVEGLRAGCIPIGYAAGNIPVVANKLGRLVVRGDISALGDALTEIATGLMAAARDPDSAMLPLDCGRITVEEFDRRARAHASSYNFDRPASMKISHVSRLLQGLGPNPVVPRQAVVPQLPPPPRGRVVAKLNRLAGLPEPLKKHLRGAFVRLVSTAAQLPGAARVEAATRYRLPAVHAWFADRYASYRAQRGMAAPTVMSPSLSADLSVAPPASMSVDERSCFVRLVYATKARRKRILW